MQTEGILLCVCESVVVFERQKKIQSLTSAWIIFDQELIQSHPTASDSHHHCAAQNSHQTQLLRVSELRIKKNNKKKKGGGGGGKKGQREMRRKEGKR